MIEPNETMGMEKPKIAMTKFMILRPGKSTLYFFTWAGASQWVVNQRQEGKDTTGWLVQPTEINT